jgi:diguanylate cyclase (GGDEF)-like protein
MPDLLKMLRQCWSLPDADPITQELLLNRQLRNVFRIIPVYAVSNAVTGTALAARIATWAGQPLTMLWCTLFLAANTIWGLHAWHKGRAARTSGPLALKGRDGIVSAILCAATGAVFGLGLYLWSALPLDEGTRILMVSYVPGLMATGVLTSMAMPLLSAVWLASLIAGSIAAILRSNYLLHGETIVFLVWYGGMLSVAMLAVSRLLVWLVDVELRAEREQQTVSLLLGDFEAGSNDWLWEADLDGNITRAGIRMGTALSLAPTDLLGAHLPGLFSPQRLLRAPSDELIGVEALRNALRGRAAFNNVIVEARIDGAPKSWKLSAKPLYEPNGRHSGWRGVANDRTDARIHEIATANRERDLQILAAHDALTGLPNRRAFLSRMKRLEGAPKSGDTRRAIMLIDLDNFKAVNDALGHSTGDTVLRQVVGRLKLGLARADFLARLGGDEFAVILDDLPAAGYEDAVASRADGLLRRLREPETVYQFHIDVRASIGATVMNGVKKARRDLLREADIALYEAKSSGRDTYRIYHPSMGDVARQRLSMVSDLAAGLQRNELIVVYQSIVDMETGRVVGCEALLRWDHPRHGRLLPSSFIPVAEESGLIVPIGEWVLQQAALAATSWDEDMFVAVNISPKQINSVGVAQSIERIVAAAGLPMRRLELEIVESSIMHDNRVALIVLERLRSRGIRVALDDFGTGYSSMAQLRDLPIDKIKLDRSFVAGLSGKNAAASRSIIASLLHLCGLMNLDVTAEGVETPEELGSLREMRCRSAQGFYFGEPLEAGAFLEFLRAAKRIPRLLRN